MGNKIGTRESSMPLPTFIAVLTLCSLLAGSAFWRQDVLVALADDPVPSEAGRAADGGDETITEPEPTATPEPTTTPTPEPTATPAPEPEPDTPTATVAEPVAPGSAAGEPDETTADSADPTTTPAATETATADPSPTPTPTEPTGTSITPTGSAQAVPASPEPPIRSNASPDVAEAITPNHARNAIPGEVIAYEHTVTNGAAEAVVDLTASSSQGWMVELVEADGTTPLGDHDGDGVPDTGSLADGASYPIVVKVTVPEDAPADVEDVTTVTASIGEGDRGSGDAAAGATDTTTINPVLTLTIDADEVVFGAVRPDGTLNPEVTASAPDALGAFYVKEGAVEITVTSNDPNWSGTCRAEENTGDSSISIAQGDLAWRVAGDTEFAAFTIGDAGDEGCFPTRGPGTNTYTLDYRLRVDWSDKPGSFGFVTVYEASTT